MLTSTMFKFSEQQRLLSACTNVQADLNLDCLYYDRNQAPFLWNILVIFNDRYSLSFSAVTSIFWKETFLLYFSILKEVIVRTSWFI